MNRTERERVIADAEAVIANYKDGEPPISQWVKDVTSCARKAHDLIFNGAVLDISVPDNETANKVILKGVGDIPVKVNVTIAS